jgi:Tfp pilus assembly protein PilO
MSTLDSLDNYYNGRKSSEAWMMVVLFSALVAYLLHTVIYPSAQDYKKQQVRENKKLNKNIASAQRYLRSITVNGDKDYKVKQKDKIIVQKKMQLNNLREKLTKIKGAVNKLSTIVYNKDNWSKFLDNIALQAKNNELKVFNISNTQYDQNGTFGKVFDVQIKCQGKYSKILAFMNDLETTDLVTNISSANIKVAPNNPIADINLSVWGIRP